MNNKKLFRSTTNRMVCGVCGGLQLCCLTVRQSNGSRLHGQNQLFHLPLQKFLLQQNIAGENKADEKRPHAAHNSRCYADGRAQHGICPLCGKFKNTFEKIAMT